MMLISLAPGLRNETFAFCSTPSDSVVISGIRIRVTNFNRQDETFLDLTPGHDTVAVAKLDNPGITIALGSMFNRYSIAGLGTVAEAGLVPIDLRRAGSLNRMTIIKTGPETDFFAVFLKDDAEGTINLLTLDSSAFEFTSTGNEQTRFSLLIQFTATGLKKDPLIFTCPQPFSETISMAGILPGEKVSVFDVAGKFWMAQTGQFEKANFPVTSLPIGYYRITTSISKRNCLLIRK
jgi:hypothetical protein